MCTHKYDLYGKTIMQCTDTGSTETAVAKAAAEHTWNQKGDNNNQLRQKKNDWNIMIVKHLLIIKRWRCGRTVVDSISWAFFALACVYKREEN